MRKSMLILGVLALFAIAGCMTPPPMNYYEPFGVTNNPIGSKVGESLDSEGGILQAALNGGITHIATVDIKYSYDYKRGISTITYIVSGE